MKFTLEIDCSNAAFGLGADAQDDEAMRREEVARLLRIAATRVEHPTATDNLRDTNGNVVGNFWFEEDEHAASTDAAAFDEDEERFGRQDGDLEGDRA